MLAQIVKEMGHLIMQLEVFIQFEEDHYIIIIAINNAR